ncbi:hypothetical protein [Burkholderia seminalis]|uniref:hypothetical protein n=1 Tax=Burkholderia seminalis TaxID=488731 RepID=UPI0015837204|nr:hypothetical protein [Burkholderia seminalis]MCA8429358.1 hypothetical protein [Burkholderia seminalis]
MNPHSRGDTLSTNNILDGVDGKLQSISARPGGGSGSRAPIIDLFKNVVQGKQRAYLVRSEFWDGKEMTVGSDPKTETIAGVTHPLARPQRMQLMVDILVRDEPVRVHAAMR